MPLETAHIAAINTDPNAPGRYGAHRGRAHSTGRQDELEQADRLLPEDRLELSKAARDLVRRNRVSPDIDFARKALDRLPPIQSSRRRQQIRERMESGFYSAPGVLGRIARRLVPDKRSRLQLS